MTVALLNTTPIVEKLAERLVQKRGDTLYKGASEDGREADVVIVDDSVSDRYDAAAAKAVGRYTLFIGSRFEPMPAGFDANLAKPFLPEELGRMLDDAELSVSASVARSDVFDADEAASSWEAEAAEPQEQPVFDRAEIDELKELLDAVEHDDAAAFHIEAAPQETNDHDWNEPVEEVLYDADAETESAENGDTSFEDIDLHARGVEALQDLMAILSDESVAKAFKAIGVRIDISFGEKA
jgi:hypothetical protein